MGPSLTLKRNSLVLPTVEAGGVATAGSFLAQLASLNERRRLGEPFGSDRSSSSRTAMPRPVLTNRGPF